MVRLIHPESHLPQGSASRSAVDCLVAVPVLTTPAWSIPAWMVGLYQVAYESAQLQVVRDFQRLWNNPPMN